MSEWKSLEESPKEGEIVEIRLPGGKIIKGVEFSQGRFWKKRVGKAGHVWNVVAWRSIEKRRESAIPKSTD